jgi:hypothetical protein
MWCSSQKSNVYPYTSNRVREECIAWDLAQIFGAIAGGYVIELSPHYKGVQLIKKNKTLWAEVNKYVKLKTGQGCLPYDPGLNGNRWEAINGFEFIGIGAKNDSIDKTNL